MTYSRAVRELFAATPHAGDAAGPAVDVARGDDRVVLSASVTAGRLERLAFRVYGCPHLIAAAELFCAEFEGREVGGLAGYRAADAVQRLEIPVEKTGRILLLEDAVRALAARLATNEEDD